MNRAAIHEAGHAVIALHFGIDIDGIAMKDRFPQTVIDGNSLDDPKRAPMERYTFLAGGIAGERLYFGNHDHEAARADQREISSRGGGQITEYLTDATTILRTHESRFNQIVEKLSLRWISTRLEAQFSSAPDTYEILSASELKTLWQGV